MTLFKADDDSNLTEIRLNNELNEAPNACVPPDDLK